MLKHFQVELNKMEDRPLSDLVAEGVKRHNFTIQEKDGRSPQKVEVCKPIFKIYCTGILLTKLLKSYCPTLCLLFFFSSFKKKQSQKP